MNAKPNILIFIDWFLPGFKAGGPIKSVSNIVNTLNKDFNFFIITSDRDIDDEDPYTSVDFNNWIQKDNYQVAYLTKEKRKAFIIQALQQQDFDCYYFNSLYSKTFTLNPFQLITKYKSNPKIIIAPRGMLGKGALKLKPLKKKIFLTVTKAIGFFKHVSWHATDEEEAKDIKLAFGEKTTIFTTPNISVLNIQKTFISKNENELNLVFFSRISPKKNLLFALEILKYFTNEQISLSIYGSIEDEIYWNKCDDLIKQTNLKAFYKGALYPNDVQSELSKYHFLFFPTLHENYGHVIVEALSAGCGLILSSNTPWKNLRKHKIGWEIDLNKKDEFVNIVKECLKMNQENYNDYRETCYQFIEKEVSKHNAIELTKKMFLQ